MTEETDHKAEGNEKDGNSMVPTKAKEAGESVKKSNPSTRKQKRKQKSLRINLCRP